MKKAKKSKGTQKKAAPKAAKQHAPVAKKSTPKPKAPTRAKAAAADVESVEAPPKTLKLSKEQIAIYKARLLDLRDHVIDGVNFLASDNLKRSHREASGELSGYSLHMADAGTDNFDREFALSLVSNEQDAIYEIEEALTRLEHSTYGLCEMCEKPIRKERLEAVPFARLCVQCQASVEKDRRRPGPTMPVFSEQGDE
jgi:RNA polymerase-binding transcription factor DksA